MNTRPDRDFGAGEGAAGTAAVRDQDRHRPSAAPAAGPAAAEMADLRGTVAGGPRADRVSVDPLRDTDRYRLVLPLDLTF